MSYLQIHHLGPQEPHTQCWHTGRRHSDHRTPTVMPIWGRCDSERDKYIWLVTAVRHQNKMLIQYLSWYKLSLYIKTYSFLFPSELQVSLALRNACGTRGRNQQFTSESESNTNTTIVSPVRLRKRSLLFKSDNNWKEFACSSIV